MGNQLSLGWMVVEGNQADTADLCLLLAFFFLGS